MAYVILVNDDNTLTASKKERIMQREKLFNKLWFLVYPTYNEYEMNKCTVLMEYVLPISREYKTEILELSNEGYEEYLKYVVPFDTDITSEHGKVELQLSFIFTDLDENGESIQRVRKTSTALIEVVSIAAWSDIVPDESLTAIDQRIIKVDSQIKQLIDAEELLCDTKADNIKYNSDENTLQLLAGENKIGDVVTLKSSGSSSDGSETKVVDFDNILKSGVEVNGISYDNVSEAIVNSKNGSIIKVISDVNENIEIPAGKIVTIDLNGNKITNSNSSHTIVNKGVLVISDSGSGDIGTIDNVNNKCAAIYNEQGATCTILAGNIARSKESGVDKDNSGGNSYYAILNQGKMTIGSLGGDNSRISITFNGHYSSLIDNGWYDGTKNTVKANAELTICGGAFSGGVNTIKNDDYGILTIYDGEFNNVTQHALMNWNVATIYDGEFKSISNSSVFDGYLNDTMDKGELTIYGGSFNGADGSPAILTNESNVNIFISGGVFSGDVSQYLSPGMEQDENGKVINM